MSNVSVYSFADASGITQYVDSVGDFLFNGTWSSSGTYTAAPLNAVTYGAGLYMCIRDNIGDNPQRVPTRSRPQSWSIMSLLYEYQDGGSGTNTTAEEAYNLAVSGTNIAWAAYYLAQIGTNTGSAAYDLAGSAYALAGSAANDATEAVGVANGAFAIAVIGTNAAATAQSTADAAYALAQIGTNTGTAALTLATSGSNLAWQAYLLASSGSGGDGTDETARATADAAYALAQIGTNTGTAALQAAATAQSTADSAFSIAVIGTNAAATAKMGADAAYALAQIGTNTGTAALNAALSAQSTADSAFSIAVAGTNAAEQRVLRSGDTMTGTLTTPNVFYTHGTASNSGTVVVDFNGEAFKTVAITAATAFDGTNYAPAHCVSYRCLVGGSGSVAVTFNGSFGILGTVPASFPSSKITVVSFTSFGTLANDVVVAYSQQA